MDADFNDFHLSAKIPGGFENMGRLFGGKSTGKIRLKTVVRCNSIVSVDTSRNIQCNPFCRTLVGGADGKGDQFGELAVKSCAKDTIQNQRAFLTESSERLMISVIPYMYLRIFFQPCEVERSERGKLMP